MSDGVSASMFKKLKDFLIGRKAGDITPAEAHKIQKASYALAHTEVKKRFSPSYESMVSGLDSEEKQIRKFAISVAKKKKAEAAVLRPLPGCKCALPGACF